MKIALLTGDSYRHKYYCNEVLHNYDVSLLVKVKRSLNIAEETKIDYLNEEDKKLLENHTALRIQKEKEYFLPKGKDFYEDKATKVLEVSQNEVNSEIVIKAFKDIKADVALVFGTALIQKPLLKIMP